ncbi:hypothetical protein OG474_44325 [Kribbella sp. NBC_01505]|uniref:hypothetical protein n=1 Tax=Kribbella sp. NBC_01505 TaxID=2903580 RepID=UPI003869CFAD
MYTVTHGTVAELEPVAPAASYLRWIVTGLREAHGWDDERVARYVLSAPDVRGAWSYEAMMELLAG